MSSNSFSHKLHTPWQCRGTCLTTSEALRLIHGGIHRLKHTFTNLPYKATTVPSPTCPKSTVAFRYGAWWWCQDEQWRWLGSVSAPAPGAGHHSLICVSAAMPKTWRGQKKKATIQPEHRKQEFSIKPIYIHSPTSISCEIAHPRSNNATFSLRSKMTGINP